MKHSLLSSDGRAFDLALEKFTRGLSPGDNGELESLTSSADLEEFECLLAAIPHWVPHRHRESAS